MVSLAMRLLTIPIFVLVVISLGFDSIWLGIIVVWVVEMGVIKPNVFMNEYAISGVARDISFSRVGNHLYGADHSLPPNRTFCRT